MTLTTSCIFKHLQQFLVIRGAVIVGWQQALAISEESRFFPEENNKEQNQGVIVVLMTWRNHLVAQYWLLLLLCLGVR